MRVIVVAFVPCGYCHLGAVGCGLLCCLSTMFWFSSSWCSVYLCLSDLDEQSIYNQRQEIKLIVVKMLLNWSHRYFSHNSNINCVGSIIKYIDFVLIHYTIILDVVFIFYDF